MAERAARLCAAYDAIVLRLDGEILRRVAHHGPIAPPPALVFPATRETVGGRTVLDRRPIHLADLQAETKEFPVGSAAARQLGSRTVLGVPLLRQGAAIGVIYIRRTEVQPFTEGQIALLQTFADQAVIAIENVRLFNETREALEQQTATAEILRAISASPTDVQPVLDAVAESAARICGAQDAMILRVEGKSLRRVAHFGAVRLILPAVRPLTRESMAGRAALEGRAIQVPDMLDAAEEYPESAPQYRGAGLRTGVAVPLLHEGAAIGVIGIRRTEVRPFTDKQIALLQTFADQAVIAIENVRLFKELGTRNRDLTEALDRQTATSEILRAISGAQTDINPVFDAIARSAVKLCGAFACRVFRAEDELLSVVGEAYGTPEARALFHGTHSEAIGRDSPSATAVRERRVVQYADVPNDPDVPERYRERARARGYRALMAVPMVRDQVVLGTIAVARAEPGRFSDKQVALLQTFADQAVIAIENVRLFNERDAANRDLKAVSQHKSEFLANMSHELRTPLNAVIGFSEVMIDRMFGELNEKQDEYLKDIHASGQHLLSLINDILDLSKIEAGRMELELTGFDLPTAIENALTLVRERAGRRGIALHQIVDQRLGQVRGDERKIKQVLLNLLSNAIKFTPDGGRIEVRAGLVDGMAEIAVADTGVGIAAEDQDAIFEEFRQVGTADKKVEGTGLGLALSRKFIELHGGRIWVHSQVGVGSTFTFTIPAP
jgi:signal transduction histidine kinase